MKFKMIINRKKFENGSTNGMHHELRTKFPSWKLVRDYPDGRNYYVNECEIKKEYFTKFKNAVKKYDGVTIL